MSLKLLIREHPQRAIAVVASSHALILRYSTSNIGADFQSGRSNAKTTAPRCMVEFSALDAVDLSNYRELHAVKVLGTLGLINVNNDTFLCIINGATRVATARPGETIQRITSVDFCPYALPEHASLGLY